VTDRFVADTVSYIDESGRDLSARIWGNRVGFRAFIDRMVADALTNGLTVGDLVTQLVRYVSPDYARSGEGRAQYAATRLAGNEMRRAHSFSTRDTALTDPRADYLRFVLDPTHPRIDLCDPLADHNEGFGRGVYPVNQCPLPPIHVNCRCRVEPLGEYGDMGKFVDALRVEYGLEDPPDLSPEELTVFRRETAQICQDVQMMFGAWFRQTGVVTTEQLVDSSPTVAGWVETVQAEKRRRRGQ
jgi:hypothetical protein